MHIAYRPASRGTTKFLEFWMELQTGGATRETPQSRRRRYEPFGIAVDESAVYWGNADGKIRTTRVPAP